MKTDPFLNNKQNWYYYRPKEGCDNMFICQYMRLDYFIQLLETGKYYVKRRKTFIDANESYKDLKLTFAPKVVSNYVLSDQPINDRLIPYSDIVDCPTACWSKNKCESYLMWKSYATEIGVCIKTTVYNFIASLKIDLNPMYDNNIVLCGSMDYKKFIPSTNEERQLFDKDMVYADENEFRFYFLIATDSKSKDGLYVPVDTKVMIDEVLLSPFICRDAADRLANMIKHTYNVEAKISKIKLRL